MTRATDELPSDTLEIDAILTKHKQDHRVWPSGRVVWHDGRAVYEYEPAKNNHDEYWGGILTVTMRHLTPEQAVEATLRRGTCRIMTCDNLNELGGDVWLECDACHWQMPLEPSTPRFSFCPSCGREVAE